MMELKKYKRKRFVPQGWKCIKLSDEFETSSGATPLTTEKEYYENGDIPWINSGELSSPYIYEATNFITQKGYESSSTKLYPIDTVLVAMYGATAGKAALLKIEACTNQAICAILPNPHYSSSFLKYNIDTLYEYLIGLSSGSARDNLSQVGIGELKLIMPKTKEEQERLVSILTCIDRKIELNCQINDNLEKMAKQLYDYWFVQFNFPDETGRPYKSSGGTMVYNKRLKQEIPIDWQVKNLIDFTEIKNGATPSTADESNYGGDIVWITPKDLSDQQSKFVYQGERNITQQGFNSCSTCMLPINSVLMSSRAPIGLVSIAKHDVCTNQGFKSFVPKDMEDSIYLYYYIKHHIKQIEQLGSGTTFKEVSRDDLCKFPILVVGAKDAYIQWVGLQNRIADKQFILEKEIAALTKQRDELLPLLMNGQASLNYHLSNDRGVFCSLSKIEQQI